MSFIFGLIVLAGIFSSAAYKLSQERNVILITDMEPDDRIALLVASINIAHRILFIGTTLMNSQRKAALVRHQLSFFKNGMQKVEVFAGSGGKPADFRLEIGSNKAGLSYIDEGKNIFSHKKLKEFENKTGL
ncbi:hypothetical protein DdX_17131 [Ditylenchus destructor]|uniref:Uncharacterized protein n=1 Tax=Ditylenchus destructor TaxID=166010 RepID=A0AAD4MRY8_9BILA|nr:hypothetical protein DdX_17131 [Ditylenchus destructor]